MNKSENHRENGSEHQKFAQLTCERCGHKTDAGEWLGFAYVGVECLTKEDREYREEVL